MGQGLVLPLVGLVAAAAAFGLWLGLRALPPGETEIIAAQAARYASETGRAATDCAARPASVPGVRLVVTCGADWAVAVDRWGRPMAAPKLGPNL
ncbi:MAG: hypothetical protein RLZZ491_2667 [Pseudomonadota bacterium]|jgi:hypothetical protein